MSTSRVDELLEEWKMVAQTERRPNPALRPRPGRSSVPVGMLAAAAIAFALIVALAQRAGGPGPQPSLPAVGTSPTVSAAAATPPAPSPTATPATSATAPSQSPGSTGTPTPRDIGAARSAVDAYTRFLVQGNYAAAWAMLGPEAQTHLGSLAAYSSERSAFFKNLGGRYTIVVSPTDVAPISAWLAGTYGATIDLEHAVLVEVDYPALAGNNAGYDLFIVNQQLNGLFLRIYDVR